MKGRGRKPRPAQFYVRDKNRGQTGNLRVAQAFNLPGTTSKAGAPSLSTALRAGSSRSLRRGGTTNACTCEATPPDSETKSPIPRSPAPVRPQREGRNDNCSTATAPVRSPSLASLDCDAGWVSAKSPTLRLRSGQAFSQRTREMGLPAARVLGEPRRLHRGCTRS
jgi:hypothetical protein